MGNSQGHFDPRLTQVEIELNKHDKVKYNLELIKLIYADSLLIDILKHLDSTGDNISFTGDSNLLGISYTDVEQQQRLERCLAPLTNYLAKVYKEHDTFRAKDDFSLTYFKLDTERVVNNCKNVKHIDLNLRIIGYDINILLFKIVISYINLLQLNNVNLGKVDRLNVGTDLRKIIFNSSAGLCFCCQSKITPTNFEAGHILSVKHGGQTVRDNLRAICFNCNRSMSTKHMYEYMVENHLMGIVNLDADVVKIWTSVIDLTNIVSKIDSSVKHLALEARLTKIGSILTKIT